MIINPNNFFENALIHEFCPYEFIKPQTLVYLAGTLEKNISIGNSFLKNKKPSYLIDLMKVINEEPNFLKVNSLTQELAETSLIVSSFFPNLISKRNNSLDYYFSVGSLAYSSLENYNQNKDLKIAYKNLSQNFSFITEKVGKINKSFNPNLSVFDINTDFIDTNVYLDLVKKIGLK